MDVKFKQGTTAENDAYVGLPGTITIDTETNNLRLHDGVTAGGHAINGARPYSKQSSALTTGNFVDVTIPDWAIRITVSLFGVSADDASHMSIQLGTSGGIQTTGYLGLSAVLEDNTAVEVQAETSRLPVVQSGAAAAVFSGIVALIKATGNQWTYSGNVARSGDTAQLHTSSGGVTLSGLLTTLRFLLDATFDFDQGELVVECFG